MLEYFDLGENIEIVEEPINPEESSHHDVETIVNGGFLLDEIFDLLGFVDGLEQPEQFPGVSHIALVGDGIPNRD